MLGDGGQSGAVEYDYTPYVSSSGQSDTLQRVVTLTFSQQREYLISAGSAHRIDGYSPNGSHYAVTITDADGSTNILAKDIHAVSTNTSRPATGIPANIATACRRTSPSTRMATGESLLNGNHADAQTSTTQSAWVASTNRLNIAAATHNKTFKRCFTP